MTNQEVVLIVLGAIGLCCAGMYLCVKVAVLRIQRRQKLLKEKPKISWTGDPKNFKKKLAQAVNERSWVAGTLPKCGQIVSDGQQWGVVTGVSGDGSFQMNDATTYQDGVFQNASRINEKANSTKWICNCHRCKYSIPHGAQFCPNCGARMMYLDQVRTETPINGVYHITYSYVMSRADHV